VSDSVVTAAAARGDDGSKRLEGGRGPGRIGRIGVFIRQVIAELRKVIWPTRKELITYTTVVIAFVVVMVSVVALFDFVFTKGVLAVFGK
jgi:preprotein translocase subunit SecE